jgi:hypothetical protein
MRHTRRKIRVHATFNRCRAATQIRLVGCYPSSASPIPVHPLEQSRAAPHLIACKHMENNMRSRARGWIMPAEDILSMLQMIEEKIASSEIEVQHRHSLIRLRHILEGDLQAAEDQPLAPEADRAAGKHFS